MSNSLYCKFHSSFPLSTISKLGTDKSICSTVWGFCMKCTSVENLSNICGNVDIKCVPHVTLLELSLPPTFPCCRRPNFHQMFIASRLHGPRSIVHCACQRFVITCRIFAFSDRYSIGRLMVLGMNSASFANRSACLLPSAITRNADELKERATVG